MISHKILSVLAIISIIFAFLTISLYLFRSIYMYMLNNKFKNNFSIKIQKNINSILPFLTKYHNSFCFLFILSFSILILCT